jgi:hypothetical protein
MTIHRETLSRVEFRWRQHENEFAERLTAAAQEAGRSISDHARELMKNALTSQEQLEHSIHTLQQEVAQLHHELRELSNIAEAVRMISDNVFILRDDLTSYVIKLLADAGSLDEKTAREWVDNVLSAE